MARYLIKDLADKMDEKNLKVVGYMDPNGMYSPDDTYWDIWNPAYDHTVAHHHGNEEGWARFHGESSQNPERLDYLETLWGIPIISDIDKLAVEVCLSGNAKGGIEANNDAGFSYDTIEGDIDYYNANGLSDNDPSWHYEKVKQIHFIRKEYGFDIINADDTGRLVMKPGIAPYADDFWTNIMRPGCPTDPEALYKECDCSFCETLRNQAGATEAGFALDSYANMIKHMRYQVKGADGLDDGVLMSGDYFAPSDVRWSEKGTETYWKSIVASEDAAVSDQFYVWKGSFARWAYNTFNLGYRVLRTDLNRSFLEIPGLRFKPEGYIYRSDLQKALLMVTAWANRVHCDLNDSRDMEGDGKIGSLFSSLEDDFANWRDTSSSGIKTIVNYIQMRNTTDQLYPDTLPIPLFKEEESQKLLYHKRFADYADMGEVNIEGEYQFVEAEPCGEPACTSDDEEPYTILYSVPGEIGEKGRILHIMNHHIISNCIMFEGIPHNYTFKIKIPNGHKVNSIYLVSPDFYNNQIDPDRDGNPDPDFYADITNDFEKWSVEGNQLVVTVPCVITYTAVLTEFESGNWTDYDRIAKALLPNIYQTNFDIGGDNDIILAGYNVLSHDVDTATVAYHIVFADEDCPPNFLDDFIDYNTARICSLYYTSHLPFPLYTGRLADIETFYVTGNINTGDIVRLEFPGINGKGCWAGNDAYDVLLPSHKVETFEGSELDEFNKTNGHLDLYVVTWNHEFFNKPRYYVENPDEFSLVVDGNFASFYPATRKELNKKILCPVFRGSVRRYQW